MQMMIIETCVTLGESHFSNVTYLWCGVAVCTVRVNSSAIKEVLIGLFKNQRMQSRAHADMSFDANK